MNQLPVIAYTYHETLESVRTFRGVPKRLLAGAALSALLFFVLMGRLILSTAHQRGAVHYLEIGLAVAGEIVFLFFAFHVREARDQEAVRRTNALVGGSPATTIRQARSNLLAFIFAQPPTAFLPVAENVRKCLDLASAAKRGFSFRAEDVLHFIFNPEARTRIVSLSLALATLITGLTLFNSEVRETALQIVVEVWPQGLALCFTAGVVLTGLYFALAVGFSCGRAVCEHISRRSSDEKEMNPALVRYLLSDLATYHVWPGPVLPVFPSTQSVLLPEHDQASSPIVAATEPTLSPPVPHAI